MSENRSLTLRQEFRFGRISPEVYKHELHNRNLDWSRQSPTEKLAALDRRLGTGVGATRQRRILVAQIVAVQNTAAAVTTTEPKPKPARKGRKA